ncbi:MAG: hypothetical protein V2J20_02495, partial [Wenzhouxiangella sp.]|nr:hypothetical protein [Wenzhouxiangella sp.]
MNDWRAQAASAIEFYCREPEKMLMTLSSTRTIAAVVLLLMATAPALADSPRELRQQVENCQTIREPEQRLACFDRLLKTPQERAGG